VELHRAVVALGVHQVIVVEVHQGGMVLGVVQVSGEQPHQGGMALGVRRVIAGEVHREAMVLGVVQVIGEGQHQEGMALGMVQRLTVRVFTVAVITLIMGELMPLITLLRWLITIMGQVVIIVAVGESPELQLLGQPLGQQPPKQILPVLTKQDMKREVPMRWGQFILVYPTDVCINLSMGQICINVVQLGLVRLMGRMESIIEWFLHLSGLTQ
jgi:hypothetical protein